MGLSLVSKLLASKKIKLGLAAILLAGGTLVVIPSCCNQLPSVREVILPISPEVLVNTKYDRILAHRERIGIDFLNPKKEFEKIKKVETFYKIQELVLGLARKSVIEKKEINYDDAYEIAKQIEILQKQTLSDYLLIDVSNKELLKARADLVESEAGHYVRLLNSSITRIPENPTEAYVEMIRMAYRTRENYSLRIERQIKLEKIFYDDALPKATPIFARPFVPIFTNNMKKEIEQRYRKSLDEYFPDVRNAY